MSPIGVGTPSQPDLRGGARRRIWAWPGPLLQATCRRQGSKPHPLIDQEGDVCSEF